MRAPLRATLSVVLAALAIECSGSMPPAQTVNGVRIDHAAPPPSARALGAVEAVDGHGCGLLGTLGTYDGAAALLSQRARALGADFVQVTSVKEPVATHECVEKTYALKGVAYRVQHETPLVRAAPTSSAR